MQLITDIQYIDHQAWLDLCQVSPYTSPFQSPEIYHLYQHVPGIKAEVLAVEEGGQLQALVVMTIQYEKGLKGHFSRRGIIYGGPLLRKPESTDAAALLLSHLSTAYRRQLIYIEVRNGFDYSPVQSALKRASFDYIPWLNFQYEHLSKESFRQGMAKSRLRQLNKGLNNGVQWRTAQDVNDVKAFYAILSDLYQHKIHKPLPPLEFFINFYQSSLAKCIVVLKDDNVIGGVLCPYSITGAIYEYYICGLDREYPQCYPSTVAMWAMVCVAEELGISRLDLMGAGEPDKPSNVRNYKKKFGPQLVEHGRYLLVMKPLLYRLGRFVILRWQGLRNYL